VKVAARRARGPSILIKSLRWPCGGLLRATASLALSGRQALGVELSDRSAFERTAMSGPPAAFMSYARFNDKHDEGQLSQFRERLAAEVQVQTGEEFAIFQDRNDIAWGENWRQRIEGALDTVTFLLAVITPGFFRSSACRGEVERFLIRESELGRQDLILPVYYVSVPELDEPERRDGDSLATVLASRQFADWRELRFEPFTSPIVRKAVAQLASRMRHASWRQPDSWPPQTAAAAKGATAEPNSTETTATVKPIVKTEPPRTWSIQTTEATSPLLVQPSTRLHLVTASWCAPACTARVS
jgi:hypothetical protein